MTFQETIKPMKTPIGSGLGLSQRMWSDKRMSRYSSCRRNSMNSSTPPTQSMPGLAAILCPVNFTEASRSALRHAVSLAQQFKARLITPCIVEPGDKRGVAEAKRELASWLNETAAGECDVQIVTKRGQAAERIVSLAARSKADLVVMGAQRRSSLQTWLSSDTTESMLRHAPAPVLLVPH
ncbi:MAG TPA: universal stress protein [Verrucomicrobiae bacterium]|nr:universal stress protein [Verrucomicrobiae bacterium]